MMKVGRRLLHCKLPDNGERHPQQTNLTGVRRSIPVYCWEVSRVPATSERLSGWMTRLGDVETLV